MKKSLSILLSFLMLLLCAYPQCALAAEDEQEWVIYWYLCASDLESNYGAATLDLAEMLEVALPDNVKVVIQAGGTKKWQSEGFASDKTYRMVYNSEDLFIEQELPSANMGDPATLADFLTYCESEYPAARKGLVFWNHGGGHVGGICADENYDDDSLTLDELYEAFRAVYEDDYDNPNFEFVGFDACLMATLDTASVLRGISKYFVASEETEPGGGWDYAAWLGAIADDPSIDGAQLGKIICDSYYAHCAARGEAADITLSCIDLGAIDPLLVAVNNLGLEGVALAEMAPIEFFGEYARGASTAESYQASKGTELVDLGDMVRRNAGIFTNSAEDVLAALEAAVVYKVNGPYRSQSSGLSCYYPFMGHEMGLVNNFTVSNTPAYSILNQYMLYGGFSEEAGEYILEAWESGFAPLPEAQPYSEMEEFYDGEEDDFFEEVDEYADVEFFEDDPDEIDEQEEPEDEGEDAQQGGFFGNFAGSQPFADGLPEMPALDMAALEDYPVEIQDGAWAVLDIGSEYAQQLKTVHFLLASVEEDASIFLGQDNDIERDWENGLFMDNFRGVWGSIDGYPVYMEVEYENEEYVLYTVPLRINGADYNLSVSYDYDAEEYSILTAAPDMGESYLGAKQQYTLQAGDTITTMHMFLDEGGEEYEWYEVDEFTFSENSQFEEFELAEGYYLLLFDMIDFRNESVLSDGVLVYIDEEGQISMESLEDEA